MYTIKEVSEKFNLASHTLRYYEKEGLLPPVHRMDNGRRVYNETDLQRIQMLCCMRDSGMSIEAIKHYNELILLGDDTVPERREIISRQKETVQQHIAEYQKYLDLLSQKLNYYDAFLDKK
ncbi:MerR family transcriptional regulator [Paenibacillus sp. GCM10012306]|uniref:MerR family transcriptional regulator n=1 Tax=Paenibacillus sp. GCM10012306 TaxID=3317342 RepID=UPI0036210FE4